MLRVLPLTHQTCLATNQVVVGCEKLLQNVEGLFYFLKQNLYMSYVLPVQGKLALNSVSSA